MILPPRAYKFLGLNVVRVLSIIALLLVFSSNIVIMVEDIKAVHKGETPSITTTDDAGNEETFECDYFDGSTVPNQAAGAFWAVLNRLFILAVTVLMVLSEVGWPDRFFASWFPVLGPDFGVGILGGIQWVIAASILSHHVDTFPLVSAWFMFAIGCINILLGIAFRAKIKVDRSISTFRDAKAKELLPGPVGNAGFKILETSAGSIFGEKSGGISRNNTGKSDDGAAAPGFGGYGFGRQGEKAAGLKGFMVSRPLESLPRYAPQPPRAKSPTPSNSSSRSSSPERPNRI